MEAVREQFTALRKLWVDTGYQGWYWLWLKLERNLDVEVIPRGPYQRKQAVQPQAAQARGEGAFVVERRRWVVERTFSWLGRYRRFSKDDEYLPTMSEAMMYAAMGHRMVRWVARSGQPTVERGRRPRQVLLPFTQVELAG